MMALMEQSTPLEHLQHAAVESIQTSPRSARNRLRWGVAFVGEYSLDVGSHGFEREKNVVRRLSRGIDERSR